MKDYAFWEYACDAVSTNSDVGDPMVMAALGLCGEAGEFADMVKKELFQGHNIDRDKAIEEVGDILWYVAAACRALRVDMSEMARANIEKLRARYPDGFSADASRNRP